MLLGRSRLAPALSRAKSGSATSSLDRPTRTLSGGEVERVNLTTCLGASLVNTLFVLDEPSIGLHPRDTGRLIRVMQQLPRQGQHAARRRARGGRDPRGRQSDRDRPRPRRSRRRAGLQRPAASALRTAARLADRRTISPGAKSIPVPAKRAGKPRGWHSRRRRARAQSARHRRRVSARRFRLRHRRLRLRQKHARPRRALPESARRAKGLATEEAPGACKRDRRRATRSSRS